MSGSDGTANALATAAGPPRRAAAWRLAPATPSSLCWAPLLLAVSALLLRVVAAQPPADPYSGEPVCGTDGATYATTAAAAAAGVPVLHCGACGACSNAQDVGVYAATAANLTVAVRGCGLRVLPGAVSACLAGLGFTPGCAACFQANIQCDASKCLAPCLQFTAAAAARRLLRVLRRLVGTGDAAGVAGQRESLSDNPCLACDEAQCGPAFLACAGANRRRAGIVSDIEREGAELCKEAAAYTGSGIGSIGSEPGPAPQPAPAPEPARYGSGGERELEPAPEPGPKPEPHEL